MLFEAIFFDCDGVLVDSEIIAAEVESKLLRDSGFVDIATERDLEGRDRVTLGRLP